ncbi:hypothetical protein K439DRAFT_255742 [Ramaria rubella]|nr:hypothetical protein K439DRAFT_255742 [Ramaria rubella]
MSTNGPFIDTKLILGVNDKVKLNSEGVEETQPSPHETPIEYDPNALPTAEAWKKMKGYGSFITQIKSIRAYDSENVWIRAKWFYHPTELPKKMQGATRLKEFGKYERINSNQADFISTDSCCGPAKMTEYDEQNVEQEDIEPESFYCRSEYDWHTKTIKRPSPPCSICNKVYNPDTDIMHFCPRTGCLRAWHASCLANANWFFKSPVNFLQRMESLETSSLPSEPSPKKKVRIKKTQAAQAIEALADSYAQIPADLLAIARQPIVRGRSLGIVGNVRSVVRARKMLQNALKGAESIPEDWLGALGTVYDADVIAPPPTKAKKKGVPLAYECPRCGEPI